MLHVWHRLGLWYARGRREREAGQARPLRTPATPARARKATLHHPLLPARVPAIAAPALIQPTVGPTPTDGRAARRALKLAAGRRAQHHAPHRTAGAQPAAMKRERSGGDEELEVKRAKAEGEAAEPEAEPQVHDDDDDEIALPKSTTRTQVKQGRECPYLDTVARGVRARRGVVGAFYLRAWATAVHPGRPTAPCPVTWALRCRCR